MIPNPLKQFESIYLELFSHKKWFEDVNAIRFAGIAAISCSGEPAEVAQSIRQTSEDLKKLQGMGGFTSQLRLIVSAMLVLHGKNPSQFMKESKEIKTMFRNEKIRRGGVYEKMAHLILQLQSPQGYVSSVSVKRFKEIYEEMKRYHWWLTGPDDFPACAILVFQEGSTREIGDKIEAIYTALNAQGFSKGDPLQTAANILFISGESPEILAGRYHSLYRLFKDNHVRIFQSDYSELASLSFLSHDPRIVVQHVLDVRAELMQFKPKPSRETSFDLAVGITFLELVQKDRNMKIISDAKALMDMQAIITAQQAAACVAACSAATTAAAAGAGS